MKTSVNLAGICLKNPVMEASGTFGSGMEYSQFVDLNRLGAVVTKGVADRPWPGNPTPRIAEVPAGMLNAIGLQNPGLETFIQRDLAFLDDFDTRVVVNVCGHTEEEYLNVVDALADQKRVDLLEINISCPNVREGGMAFGTDPAMVEYITASVKKRAAQPIIIKLTPNVTSIADVARAAEAGGADVISLINTITGMKIDVGHRTFALANKTGGMSGPAIHPIAVRMVYEAAQAVKIPIIGMGGIATAEDALEMILAGATAVAIGTANFYRPRATLDVIEGIETYMQDQGVEDIRELIGAVRQAGG
nr:dihydroorotate dehydrogenase [Shuttleworthia satelles]